MEAAPASMTIRDVAREARVGLGTVSRVLNGGSHVSPATRDRVLATINRLGFRPHAQARRILRRRAEMVCFLLSNRDFLHAFHAGILQGVETYARTVKQHVVFGVVHYGAKTPPHRISLPPVLEERGWVDGLILAGTIYPNFLRRIQSMQVPFVAFGNNVFGLEGTRRFDQVGFNGERAEAEATQFVIDHGHRAIVFVGDSVYPWFRHRYKGYEQAMRANHLEPGGLMSHRSSSFVEYGEWAAGCVLSLKPRPTAVLAGNDEVAYGLWRSFRRLGVRVPEDISLVGFDDRQEAVLMDPPLTTVRVYREEIGKACMKLLLDRLHHPHRRFREEMLPTEFVIRGTVKMLEASARTVGA